MPSAVYIDGCVSKCSLNNFFEKKRCLQSARCSDAGAGQINPNFTGLSAQAMCSYFFREVNVTLFSDFAGSAAALSSRPALATIVNNADNGLVVVPLLELACGVSSVKTSAGTSSCSLRTFAAGGIAA
jgi:hypothetical protein